METITTPYFYVIKNKKTGKTYAGSRWKKGCHPSELLKPNGYMTSSKEVNNIIKECGTDIFEIIKIVECKNGSDANNIETEYLTEKSAAENNTFYNKHNNEKFNYKGDRDIVTNIKMYQTHYGFKLSKFNLNGGWWQKSDDILEYTLERIILAYGPI